MATAPNMRVTSTLPIPPGNAPAGGETADFISRLLTIPVALSSGPVSAKPADGERDTQDDPTVATFGDAGAGSGAAAQDLLAGLIPIVQAQDDYPIAVTFQPQAPKAVAGEGDASDSELVAAPTMAPSAVPTPTSPVLASLPVAAAAAPAAPAAAAPPATNATAAAARIAAAPAPASAPRHVAPLAPPVDTTSRPAATTVAAVAPKPSAETAGLPQTGIAPAEIDGKALQPDKALPADPHPAPAAPAREPPIPIAIASDPDRKQPVAASEPIKPAKTADAPPPTARPAEPSPAFRPAPEVSAAPDQTEAPAKPIAIPAPPESEPSPSTAAAEAGARLQPLRDALPRPGEARPARRSAAAPPARVGGPAPAARSADTMAPAAAPEVRPASAEPRPIPADAAVATTTSVAAQTPSTPQRVDGRTTAAESVERSVDRALDLARDGEWLDRLARDIAGAGDRDGTLRFRLHPQSLGHMRVELSQTEQGASVRLSVETEAARTLLADAQPRLLAEARAQGVRIAEASVHLAGSDQQQSGSWSGRQEDARQGPVVRTPTAPDQDNEAPDRPRRSRSDRYA